MINTIQQRPQSRQYRRKNSIARPITRQADEQQSEKCFQRGKQYQQKNQHEKAKEFYLQSIVHNSNNFKALCNLGSCFRAEGHFTAAITSYQRAILIKSDDSISNYNLANTYRIIGDQDKAIELYKKVIRLEEGVSSGNQESNPKENNKNYSTIYKDSYINMGVCYQNMSMYTEALQCYEKIQDQNGDSSDQSILFNSAMCLKKILYKLVATKGMSPVSGFQNQSSQPQHFSASTTNSYSNPKLILDHVSKTTQLFEKVLKINPQSEVSRLSLIQLIYLKDSTSQSALTQCVEKFTELSQEGSHSSQFIKEEAARLKAFCLNLQKKYEDSAKLYKETMLKKLGSKGSGSNNINKYDIQNGSTIAKNFTSKEEPTSSIATKGNIIQKKQSMKQQTKKVQQQKKTSTTKVADINGSIEKKKSNSIYQSQSQSKQPQNQNIACQSQVQQRPQTAKSIKTKVKEAKQTRFYQLLNSLVKMTSANQCTFSQCMNKVQKQSELNEKDNYELRVIICSVWSEKDTEIKEDAVKKANDIYLNYFLNGNSNIKITRELFRLQTHRAIASILTMLGQSQKAIEHYQIISQAYEQPGKESTQKGSLLELHSGLGANYENQGLHQQAVGQFKKALELDKQNYVLHFNLGYCLQCIGGRQKQAVQEYKQFLRQVKSVQSKKQQKTEEKVPEAKLLNDRSVQQYIIQAEINIFSCLCSLQAMETNAQQQLENQKEKEKGLRESISKSCDQILQKIKITYNNDITKFRQNFDDQVILGFYLKAAEIYQNKIVEAEGRDAEGRNDSDTNFRRGQSRNSRSESGSQKENRKIRIRKKTDLFNSSKTMSNLGKKYSEQMNGVDLTSLSPEQKVKFYKETLVWIYMALLELPYVPDRQEILINCGNIFYQQGEFIGALRFYNNLKNLQIAKNNIALAYFHLHQYQKAMLTLMQALQSNPDNYIYNANYQIFCWAYGYNQNDIDGLGDKSDKNIIFQAYPNNSTQQFSQRLQMAKVLIYLLTNEVSSMMAKLQQQQQENKSTKLQDYQSPQSSQQQKGYQKVLLQGILKDLQKLDLQSSNSLSKQQSLSRIPGHLRRKYLFLHKYFKKNAAQKNSQKQKLQSKLYTFVQKAMMIVLVRYQTQQKLTLAADELIKLIKNEQPLLEETQNSTDIVCSLLGLLILGNAPKSTEQSTPEQQTNQEHKTSLMKLKEHIIKSIQSSQIPVKFHHLTFQDQAFASCDSSSQTPSSTPIPSKIFTIRYPQLELNPKNVFHSLMLWQGELQNQYLFLHRIIQSAVYDDNEGVTAATEIGLASPLTIQYAFPHFNSDDCQDSQMKFVNICAQMLGVGLRVECQGKDDRVRDIDVYDKKGILATLFDTNDSNSGLISLDDTKLKLFKQYMRKLQKQLPEKLIQTELPQQTSMKKAQQNKNKHLQPQDKLLRLQLTQQLKPLLITLRFITFQKYVNFIQSLNNLLAFKQKNVINFVTSTKQIQPSKQITLVLNGLVNVRCSWGERKNVELKTCVQDMIKFNMSTEAWAVFKVSQDQLLKGIQSWFKAADREVKAQLDRVLKKNQNLSRLKVWHQARSMIKS